MDGSLSIISTNTNTIASSSWLLRLPLALWYSDTWKNPFFKAYWHPLAPSLAVDLYGTSHSRSHSRSRS